MGLLKKETKTTQEDECFFLVNKKSPKHITVHPHEWREGRLGESAFIRMMYLMKDVARHQGQPINENQLISKYKLQDLRRFIDSLTPRLRRK